MLITVKEIPAIDEVTIVMTKHEASVLLQITRYVGGSPNGPRGILDTLRHRLEDASIEPTYHNVMGSLSIDKPGGL